MAKTKRRKSKGRKIKKRSSKRRSSARKSRRRSHNPRMNNPPVDWGAVRNLVGYSAISFLGYAIPGAIEPFITKKPSYGMTSIISAVGGVATVALSSRTNSSYLRLLGAGMLGRAVLEAASMHEPTRRFLENSQLPQKNKATGDSKAESEVSVKTPPKNKPVPYTKAQDPPSVLEYFIQVAPTKGQIATWNDEKKVFVLKSGQAVNPQSLVEVPITMMDKQGKIFYVQGPGGDKDMIPLMESAGKAWAEGTDGNDFWGGVPLKMLSTGAAMAGYYDYAPTMGGFWPPFAGPGFPGYERYGTPEYAIFGGDGGDGLNGYYNYAPTMGGYYNYAPTMGGYYNYAPTMGS